VPPGNTTLVDAFMTRVRRPQVGGHPPRAALAAELRPRGGGRTIVTTAPAARSASSGLRYISRFISNSFSTSIATRLPVRVAPYPCSTILPYVIMVR